MNARSQRRKWYAVPIMTGRGIEIRHRATSIPGTFCLEATWEHAPVPIGHFWYCWIGNTTIYMLDCYVSHHYRRLGLLTRLLEKLVKDFESCRRIVTGAGTRESLPWMKKIGFVQDADGWTFVIPSRNPKPETERKKPCRRK